MSKEPSKGAIEKACQLFRYGRDAYEDPDLHPIARANIRAFARFIDHVSEVAKSVNASLQAHDHPGYSSLYELILPDPEPDVLAEAIGKLLDNDPVCAGRVLISTVIAIADLARKVQP